MKKFLLLIIAFLIIEIPSFASKEINYMKYVSLNIPEYESVSYDAKKLYNDENLYKMLLHGIECYYTENYSEAIKIFNKLVAAQPNNFLNYYNLASVYMQLNNFEKALIYINKAIDFAPEFSSNYVNRGIIMSNLYNDKAKSLKDYKKAIELNSENYAAYNNIGNLYIKYQEYPQAIKAYNSALKIKENDVSFYNKGNAYALIGKYNVAIKDYNSAIKLNNTNPLSYYKRGLSQESIGNYKEAISDYDIAVQYDFHDMDIYLFRGHCYEILKEYQNAIANYTKAIEYNENCYLAYFYRGQIYLNIYKDVDKALEDLSTYEKIKNKSK